MSQSPMDMPHEPVPDDFELQYSGKVDQIVPVYKYRAKKSGVRIVVAQVEGPLVNGFFCIATEAHDDDGLPHTLEHMIFLGSEDYPFKGVLDLLANRCFASGTNAWTDTDHTCYTMTTAGSDGFLNLLPIFLDHILYPTLKESGYITEVHHVNGEGEDAGVVYSEMQGRENSGESRSHLEMLRGLYPGVCGYKSETGGILHNLRTSTSHEKVKSYFKQYYRPENIYLIVTGMVEPVDILKKFSSFEQKILSKGQRPSYTRPWQTPVPPLTETVVKNIQYGSDEEEQGMVTVAWRGPPAEDQVGLAAMMLLLEYMTDSPVSPLQRDFVELDDPYCSEVHYSIIENASSCVSVSFENVPTEKLKDIPTRLLGVLESLGAQREKIDEKRLHSIVHRQLLTALSTLEVSPHDTIAFHVIGEFLYGKSNADMDVRLNNIETFRSLAKQPLQYWVDLINGFLVQHHYVAILSEPSIALMKQMGEAESKRIADQKKRLGPEGLATKQRELEAAITQNEIAPSSAMLTSVPVPSTASIHFHTLRPYSNHGDAETNPVCPVFPLDKIPFTFQLDDIKTNFVTMSVLMDTTALTRSLRCYLPLYLEVILESPVLRDGVLLSHEQMINELSADTIAHASSLGVNGSRFSCGQYASYAVVNLRVEMERYVKGVQLLSELLYHVQFTAERVRVVANKMSSDVASMKRSGEIISQLLHNEMLFNKDSNHHVSSMLRQQKFLTELVSSMDQDKENGQKVISTLEELRSALTKPSSLRLHMSANTERLAQHCQDPASVWINSFAPKGTARSGERYPVRGDLDLVRPRSQCDSTAMITGVGSVESSYLILTTPCLLPFKHEDVPRIMVFEQYLTQFEGPLWKMIRGLGLCYHYSLKFNAETGQLRFTLQRSSLLVDAFKTAKKIIDEYVGGEGSQFDSVSLESCKSSLIYEIIDDEKTPSESSIQSLLSYYRGIGHDYHKWLIEKVLTVSIDDLRRVGQQYFKSLFDLEKSTVAICCHPTKVSEIWQGFRKECGADLTVIPSLDTSLLTSL